MQREVVGAALGLLESASGPRTTLVAPYAWKDDPGWRERYNRVDPADRGRLLALGEERRRRRGEAKRHKVSRVFNPAR